MSDDTALDLIVHSPADLAQMHIEYAERIRSDPGVRFGVKSIDRHVIPFRPGDLVCFCGRPGHGKTSLAARMAREVAESIIVRGRGDREAVFYITLEQTAEELMAFFAAGDAYSVTDYAWGRVDLDIVRANAVASVRNQIWVIGHSLRNAAKRAPSLTVDMIWSALEHVRRKYDRVPRLIVIDYVQLIPLARPAVSRTETINETIVLCKELAIRAGVPMIVNVQAGRSVDARDPPIPKMGDAQWASAIEQHADKFFGLWRPWKTENPGDEIAIATYGVKFPNSPELLILDMSKQRMDDGSRVWALRFSPQELTLADMEVRIPDRPR